MSARAARKHFIRLGEFDVRVRTTVNSSPNLSVSFQYNPQQQEVIWQLTNNSSTPAYAALYRGLPGYSPIYFFGDAFPMVYLANGIPSCQSLQFLQENLACIGLLHIPGSFISYPAFIFYLPPGYTLEVPEYGFPTVAGLRATLVPVTPKSSGNYLVYYDPVLPYAYMYEAGVQVAYLPDPFTFYTVQFDLPQPYPNVFNYWVFGNNNILASNIITKAFLGASYSLALTAEVIASLLASKI